MRKRLATVLRSLADRFDQPQVFQTATASTQFAGSGLTVNVYGADPRDFPDDFNWAMRSGGLH